MSPRIRVQTRAGRCYRRAGEARLRSWQPAAALGFIAVVCLAPKLFAGRISLVEAQARALERNADLRSAQAGVEAALAQTQTAREFPNPTLALSTSGIATDGRGNGSPLHNEFLQRSYDSIVSLNQLLETAGKRSLRRESAEAGQRVAEAQRDEARRWLLQSVTQAYVAALVAREDVGILGNSAASLRREADVAALRLKTGDISATDKDQIEMAADRFALDADTARHTATVATILLETLVGEAAPTGETELTDTLEDLAAAAPRVTTSDTIAGERPDLVAAEANVRKAEAELRLQQRARIPDLTVSAQFEHHPPDQPNTAGLGFSVPLPLWNRNRGAIQAARAARAQAEAQMDRTRIQAAAEIATARSALRDAEARAAAFHQQMLPKSAAVLRAITYAYEKGGASLLDLLSAQRNDNDIRQAAAHATADAANARVALASALNRFSAPHQP